MASESRLLVMVPTRQLEQLRDFAEASHGQCYLTFLLVMEILVAHGRMHIERFPATNELAGHHLINFCVPTVEGSHTCVAARLSLAASLQHVVRQFLSLLSPEVPDAAG